MGIDFKLKSEGGRKGINLTPMGEQGLCGSSVGFNSIKHINPFHPSIVILNEVKNLGFNSIKHINPFHPSVVILNEVKNLGFNSIKHINPFRPSVVILNEVKNLGFNSIKYINPFRLRGFSCISCVYLRAFVAYDKHCQATAIDLMMDRRKI